MESDEQVHPDAVDEVAFKAALSTWASGVTITTTNDGDSWWGFTASAFASLSLRPPLVLVCLAKDALCYDAFSHADEFVVNVLAQDQRELSLRFATKDVDKFESGEFEANSRGLPVLRGAIAILDCATSATHDGGDHIILVGRVREVSLSDGEPLVYHAGGFARLSRVSA